MVEFSRLHPVTLTTILDMIIVLKSSWRLWADLLSSVA